MSRPWNCPVCQTVIILGDPPSDGKICCPACGTQFAYPSPRPAPRRRESNAGGDDRDETANNHTPKVRR